jgi:hypothetical protein
VVLKPTLREEARHRAIARNEGGAGRANQTKQGAIRGIRACRSMGMKSSPFTSILLLMLATAASVGFARTTVKPTGMGFYPEIISFTATPGAVKAGEWVTLSWETRGAVSVTLEARPEEGRPQDPRIQTGLPATGTLSVQPSETTYYRLRCQTVFSGQACGIIEAKVDVMQRPPRLIESGF